MKLKIILGVLAIGILLGISNQDFIFSVLADVIHKLYFAEYAEFDAKSAGGFFGMGRRINISAKLTF